MTMFTDAYVAIRNSDEDFSKRLTEAEVMERHDSQNNATEYAKCSPMHNIKHISAEDLNAVSDALGVELDNRVNLDKLQRESDEETIAELMEEVADADQRTEEARENAKGWERKYYEANGNWESWRSKCMDAERKIEKLKVELEVETSNRKYAEKLMDEALIAKYQDEQLSVMLAAKFVDVSKRNSEVG